MKTLLALLILGLSQNADAIAIYRDAPQGTTTVANGSAVVGLQRIEIGRYWTWHGKARKYDYVPLYAVSAVPEASTYGMLLAGLGLVAWRVRRVK